MPIKVAKHKPPSIPELRESTFKDIDGIERIRVTDRTSEEILSAISANRPIAEALHALFCHHPETHAHSIRVALMVVDIGRQYLPVDRLFILGAGGLLHDLGKLDIPLAILDKAGKLTQQETGIMARHTDFGRARVEMMKLSEPAQLALFHHTDRHAMSDPFLSKSLELLRICDIADALS